MTRRDEMPAVPLQYAPPRRGRGRWLRAIAAAMLMAAAGMAFAWLAMNRHRVEAMADRAQVQAARAAAATQQATTAPLDEYFVTLEQRRSARLGDGRLVVSIGDITGGQVVLRITDDAGNDLLPPAAVREGEALEFADAQGAPLRVEVLKLINNLVGDDSAELTIRPAEPAPATQPALSEAEKVEALLARILATRDAVFIRNGGEHSAAEAVGHLRMKWRQAGGAENPDATAEDFIEKIASRSSLSGREYRIRLADGREVPSGQWLREQLREIEAEREEPATRPAAPAESNTNR